MAKFHEFVIDQNQILQARGRQNSGNPYFWDWGSQTHTYGLWDPQVGNPETLF